jgi:hypothetical protein
VAQSWLSKRNNVTESKNPISRRENVKPAKTVRSPSLHL